jgi:hypothetical protein
MNPKSTGEKQSNVLRKTDKPMVDDGKMDVKWNADDRLYKDLEDGEYDGKHAAKVLKKRQDDGEKSSEKCPVCGNILVFEEGCLNCKHCGHSKCG